MKSFIQYTLAATTLAAGVAAHGHHHHHHHAKKDAGSQVEKREPDAVTVYVAGPTQTVYELGGELVDAEDARHGLDGGNFVVVGESVPTYSPPPPPKPTTSSAIAEMGAQFIESRSSSSPSSSSSTTFSSSAPPPPPTTTASPTTTSQPKPRPTSSAAPRPSAPSTGGGLDSSFPSGEVKCSEFPSSFGAVPLNWLNMDGWAGLQRVPGYSTRSLSISEIHTGISGETCEPGTMCSYACPPGYQKTQWPDAQGNTGQSIGGLFCNSDGYLELTRDNHDTLCERGEGGVVIQNDLDEVVATCRTDYPGTESMVIPIFAQPGESLEVCNPSQNGYYIWDGKATSAQYYINKKGYNVDDACVWNSAIDPEGAGNWSPVILGVGKAESGITFISIFQNRPTSYAQLDFNIEIKGDVSSECWYRNGRWSGGSDGCTTGLRSGGKAIVRYY